MGWALHYFPFFLMSRQLFLHHYHPALWFAILSFCGSFDLVTSSLRPRIRLYTAAVLLVLAIYTFSYFSPLTYGGQWTKGQCQKAKWMKTWDFACNDFPNDYAEYSGITAHVTQESTAKATVIGGEGEGRAPVVVPEEVGNVLKAGKDSETTKGLGAVAEPGFDAFGNLDDPKDIKSEPAKEKVEIEKEFSTVMVNTDSPEKHETEQEDIPIDATAAVGDKKPEGSSEAPLAASVAENAPPAPPQGPLEHDEQEEEDARSDLFADDAKLD